MNEALIGLIGVVAGGLLTGAVSLLMARRKERRDLRRAARLVQYELQAARRTGNVMLVELRDRERAEQEALESGDESRVHEQFEHRQTPSPAMRGVLNQHMIQRVSTAQWEAERAVLAAGLTEASWTKVSIAYECVTAVAPLVDALFDDHALPEPGNLDGIQSAVDRASQAIETLSRLAA